MSQARNKLILVMKMILQLFRAIRVLLFYLALFLFFITAFSLNFLQVINYVLFSRTLPDVRRLINNWLQDIILTSFLYIFEHRCKVTFRLHVDSAETLATFGHKNSLLIVNHSHELDAFFYWQCCQMLDSLGSIKAFTKAAFRWMPIVGWMLWFNESIFLQENWRKDERNIKRSLDRLKRYTAPYLLAFAPEGTRFTEEKYCDSQAFIEEFNIPISLKHHLLPRVKGFTTTMHHMMLKTKNNFTVYNAEFVCQRGEGHNDSAAEPTLHNFLQGKPFQVDCYLEELPAIALPDPSLPNAEYTKFLYALFERKDRLVDEFRTNGRFTQRAIVHTKRTTYEQLFKFIVFNVILSGSLVCLVLYLALITQGLLWKLIIFGSLILIAYTMKVTFQMVGN